MHRHPPDSQESEERRRRFLAYLADARTSDEEKGVITLVLLGHAGVHKPTLAMFLAADMGYVVLQRATLARLDRRIALRS
jgi:hypothetical protein